MNKRLIITLFVILAVALGVWWLGNRDVVAVTNFEECAEAGNPVMESYPRQCRHEGVTFTEFIGNELEKSDMIRLSAPRPNQTISSPLIIRGEARGNWFFEASFPVTLVNWDGLIIAESFVMAQDEWMTTEFVPFEGKIEFEIDPSTWTNRGYLILKKDNPSGLPEHDDAMEIPIIYQGLPAR